MINTGATPYKGREKQMKWNKNAFIKFPEDFEQERLEPDVNVERGQRMNTVHHICKYHKTTDIAKAYEKSFGEKYPYPEGIERIFLRAVFKTGYWSDYIQETCKKLFK
jgi:hypothetical protein